MALNVDMVSLATIITAISTFFLALGTFYYAYTNRKMMIARERELKKPRKTDEMNSIIKPLINECIKEIESLSKFPVWIPKNCTQFLSKYDKNNYKKMIMREFLQNREKIFEMITWHDFRIQRFNQIYNEMIISIKNEDFIKNVKKIINKFNENTKKDVEYNENVLNIIVHHILVGTDLKENNLDGWFKIFWKDFGKGFLRIKENDNINDYIRRLGKMQKDLIQEDKNIKNELEKICNDYSIKYGISLKDNLNDYLG